VAEHLYTFDNPPSARHLAQACEVLENDGVLAYPVDSNWAIGCDAKSSRAIERIHRLKPLHPRERPFSLLCSSIGMAADFGNIDNVVYRWVKKIWPGPYTILVERHKNLPRQIRDKRKVVGLRVPNSPMMLALIEAFGRPLASTSVPEMAEQQAPQLGYQVAELIGHGTDLILDLGEELSGVESTIVDFTSGAPEVVRVGAGDPHIFA